METTGDASHGFIARCMLRCRGGGGGASKQTKANTLQDAPSVPTKASTSMQSGKGSAAGAEASSTTGGKKKNARFDDKTPKPLAKSNSIDDLLERTKNANSSWAGPQNKGSRKSYAESGAGQTTMEHMLERAKTPAAYSVRGDNLTVDLLERTKDVRPKAQQEHVVNESEQLISHPYGAVAIQSFQPEDEAELGFEKGDRLLIFNVEERGWLSALRVDLDAGAEGMPYGYVPETFVRREELMPAVALEQFVAWDASQLSLNHGEIVGVLGEPPAGRGWAVVFKGEGSEAPHGPGIVPREYIHPSTLAVAKANYNAGSGMEIDLQKGQHVWALPFEVGHGWVEVIAAATGARGVVPQGYLQEKKTRPAKGLSPPVEPSNAAKPNSQVDEGTAAADAMQAAFREVEATKEKAARETEAAREQAAREAEAAKAKAAQEAEEAKAQAALQVEEANKAAHEAELAAKEAEETARKAKEALAFYEQRQQSEGAAMRSEVEQLKAELDASKLQVKAEQARADAIEKQWIAEAAQRRQLHNKLQDMVGNLRVSCRIRPLTAAERKANAEEVVEVKRAGDKEIVSVFHQAVGEKEPSARRFDFTHIYGQNSKQEDVFRDTEPLMTSVLDGYNVCIFAYGQSGTGKTYTMEGTTKDPGLAPRAMSRLFEVMRERESSGNFEHECFMSMVEIYNESIRDLLADPAEDHSRKKYDIQRDPALGMYVRDLRTAEVHSAEAAQELINTGHTHRSVGVTNLNEQSSRSHMVLTITVLTTNVRSGQRFVGKLSLCDLAGSERLSKIDTKGQALKETQAINKSLSALGAVLNGLARNDGHVPYRDSKLTYLLQDSLGGNAKTLMMVACGPTKDSSSETVSSLQFASRAKAVTMGPAKANQKPKEKAEQAARPITRAAPRTEI